VQLFSTVTMIKKKTLACVLWCIVLSNQLGQKTALGKTIKMSRSPCYDFELVTRAEWGARPPTSISHIDGIVNMTFVHHTAMAFCYDKEACTEEMHEIQNLHMDVNGWSDIGYSFLIGEDGRVYEGRGWGVVGAHTANYNSFAYGFSVMGNFMDRSPNNAALMATQAIIDCGVEKGYLTAGYELFGHRDGRCTLCPGDYLYALIRGWPHYSTRSIPIYCTQQKSTV